MLQHLIFLLLEVWKFVALPTQFVKLSVLNQKEMAKQLMTVISNLVSLEVVLQSTQGKFGGTHLLFNTKK
jgi:hypothetical protein